MQSSTYAKLGGIPVAVLGLGGYVAIALALLAPGERARVAAAALTLTGFGFSAYLTYLELFVIDAICQWCVASAVLLTGLAVLSVWRLLLAEPEADLIRRAAPPAEHGRCCASQRADGITCRAWGARGHSPSRRRRLPARRPRSCRDIAPARPCRSPRAFSHRPAWSTRRG